MRAVIEPICEADWKKELCLQDSKTEQQAPCYERIATKMLQLLDGEWSALRIDCPSPLGGGGAACLAGMRRGLYARESLVTTRVSNSLDGEGRWEGMSPKNRRSRRKADSRKEKMEAGRQAGREDEKSGNGKV